jgi:hypothetical protein
MKLAVLFGLLAMWVPAARALAPDDPPAQPPAEAAPAPTAEAVPAPTAEAVPAPTAEAVPAPTAEAVPAPTAEAVPAPTAEAAPAPTAEAVPAPAPEKTPSPGATKADKPAAPAPGPAVKKRFWENKPPKVKQTEAAFVTLGTGILMAGLGFCLHFDAYQLNERYHDKAEALGQDLLDSGAEAATAQAAADEYYDDQREEYVRPKTIAAVVLYGVGGAAIVAGSVWYAIAKKKERAGARKSASYAPALGPDSVGFQASFTF